MTPPFKLNQHPRQPRPLLSEPPAGYFDQLPTRVMARLPQAEASAAGWAWLTWLPGAWRTGLASTLLLGGFAASFWLASAPPAPKAVGKVTLAAVPNAQLVNYLLTSGTRVENTDLVLLTGSDLQLTQGFMKASDAELTNALDAQPAEELLYL